MAVKLQLPFAHINLRRNPFGQVPLSQWPRVLVPEPGLGLPQLATYLSIPGRAVQILGAAGRGKSTHLRALNALLSRPPITVIAVEDRPTIPEARVVCIDEAQRLDVAARAEVFGRRASFILASHEDLSAELGAQGVAVQTREVRGLCHQELAQMIDKRIEWARRSPGPVPEVSPQALNWLVARYGGDTRGILGVLYETFQALERVVHVQVSDLCRAGS